MPEATLIIDDDATFNAVLVRTLERRDYPARGAGDPVAALALSQEIKPSRVVLDLNLNGSSGLALIPRLLAINPACRIVVDLEPAAAIGQELDAFAAGPLDLDETIADQSDAAVDHDRPGGDLHHDGGAAALSGAE